jgi:hypothetical protein
MNSFDVVIIVLAQADMYQQFVVHNLVSKQQLSRNTQFLAELVLT